MRAFLYTVILLAGVVVGCAGQEKTLPQGDAGARKLYLNKCSKCHKLYDPARYSQQQWDGWMDKMSRKAKLNGEQKQVIEDYVTSNLRPSPTPATVSQPLR